MAMPNLFSPDQELQLRRKVKAELRSSLRRVRTATPEATRVRAAESIRARLETLNVWSGNHVGLYRPIDGRAEVDTQGFDEDARRHGMRVAFPTMDEETGELRFRWVDATSEGRTDAGQFEERGYGFLEPLPALPLVTEPLDVVIVPGLGFDPRGHRIGYGRGHYDRLLSRWPGAKAIGVCFDFQLLAELPNEPHDVPLHLVVTDRRAFAAGEEL